VQTLLRIGHPVLPMRLSRQFPSGDGRSELTEQKMSEKLKDKIANPKAHFEKPKEVVQDDALSHDEKKKTLNTWEQDERQLLTASNEGMAGSDEGVRKDGDNRLDEVVRAKDKIGEKPKHKPSH
jgi:hypothetical protein